MNKFAVIINFEIGRRIVEFEQQGRERAEYGKETLKDINKALTSEFGRGYSVDNLQLMRSFYLTYQPVSNLSGKKKYGTPSRNLQNNKNDGFKLSWSHYVELIKMDNNERGFYEIEAFENNWSVRELKRQYNASLFERVALSKNKEDVNISFVAKRIHKKWQWECTCPVYFVLICIYNQKFIP